MGLTQRLEGVLQAHNSIGVPPDFYLRDGRLPGTHLLCPRIDSSDFTVTLCIEVLISFNSANFARYKKRIYHQAPDLWWEYVPGQAVIFLDLGQLDAHLRACGGGTYGIFETLNSGGCFFE